MSMQKTQSFFFQKTTSKWNHFGTFPELGKPIRENKLLDHARESIENAQKAVKEASDAYIAFRQNPPEDSMVSSLTDQDPIINFNNACKNIKKAHKAYIDSIEEATQVVSMIKDGQEKIDLSSAIHTSCTAVTSSLTEAMEMKGNKFKVSLKRTDEVDVVYLTHSTFFENLVSNINMHVTAFDKASQQKEKATTADASMNTSISN